MPIIYNNKNERMRYDAFQALQKAGVNPLEAAVAAVKEIEASIATFSAQLKTMPESIQFKAHKILQDMRAQAAKLWLDIADYVYSKPKPEIFDSEMGDAIQQVANKTQMLELIMKLNYPEKKADAKPNGNGNGAGH